MIIQVVNFNLEGITHEQYVGAATELAPAFNKLKGLRSKVWLADKDNNIYGGVYTWENLESMEEYVTSSFYNEVLDSNPNLVNISYKAYEVLDDPTQITK
tara:strand:- start:112845 stop:113144 length:300 start_codon:yes stop_codon:yes gene_type:complete